MERERGMPSFLRRRLLLPLLLSLSLVSLRPQSAAEAQLTADLRGSALLRGEAATQTLRREGASAREVDYAVRMLQESEGETAPKGWQGMVCKALERMQGRAEGTMEEAFHAAHAAGEAGCAHGAPGMGRVEETLSAPAAAAEDVIYAVRLAQLLHAAGGNEGFDANDAVARVVAAKEEGDLYAYGSAGASPAMAPPLVVLVIDALEELQTVHGDALSDESKQAISRVATEMTALLPAPAPAASSAAAASAMAAGSTASLAAMTGSAAADPSLVAPLRVLTKDKGMKVNAKTVQLLTELLLQQRSTESPEQAWRALRALRTIGRLSIAPVTARMEVSCDADTRPGTVLTGADAQIRFEARDIFGAPAKVESATVKKIVHFDTQEALLQESVEMAAVDTENAGQDVGTAFTHTVEGSTLGEHTGRVDVTFSLRITGRNKAVSVVRSFSVVRRATIHNTRFLLSRTSSTTPSADVVVHAEEDLTDHHIVGATSSLESIHVLFRVKYADGKNDGAAPAQHLVRLHHLDSKTEFYAVATAEEASNLEGSSVAPDGLSASKDGTLYAATISLVSQVERLGHHSGHYAVSVHVGDLNLDVPAAFHLGTITIELPDPVEREYPLYTRPLLYESDQSLEPMPEIHHQFRAPEKRPPAFVSTMFMILAALPFFILLLSMLRVGGNLGLLFTSGAGTLPIKALVMQATIGIILCLLAGYWFARIDVFTMLKYLAVVLIVGTVIANNTLSHITNLRANLRRASNTT